MATRTREPKGTSARIFIVDDHPIIRQGLRELIENEPDLTVCGEASSALEALKAVESLKPDVAVVDISLNKDLGGIELIKDFKNRLPKMPVLVLSMHDESLFAERALRAGARGYITKDEGTEKFLVALRKVLSGEIFLNERMASKLLSGLVEGPSKNPAVGVERLTNRELEVFNMIGQGYGTKKIADKLFLSVKTVEAHRLHIKEKLKVKTATELLQAAFQWAQSERMR